MEIVNYLLLFLLLIKVSNAEDQPIIETTIGKIFGTVKEVDVFGQAMRVENYFGIPYAEPPINDLRFKKSEPKRPLLSPLNATKFGKVCFQMDVLPTREMEMSENCLFLNLYVPAHRDGVLSTIVFIHGIAFVAGTSNMYVSNTFSAYGNVIVVTFNYRLSVFGFLSTEDTYAPGNYALWDQHLAIKWVNDNIHAFGGDPYKVTLVGSSAGAISALAQSLFIGNSGLFQRVILQSGSTEARPYNFNFAKPRLDAEELGRLVGCEDMLPEQLIRCLRDVPVGKIMDTLNSFPNGFIKFPVPFILNTADGQFLKEGLHDTLRSDSYVSAFGRSFFSSLDFLSGFNTNDGCYVLAPLLGVSDPNSFEPSPTLEEMYLIPFALSKAFGCDVQSVPELVKSIVLQEYADPDEKENTWDKLVALCTDLSVGESQLETNQWHETLARLNVNTYLYEFDVLPFSSGHLLPNPSWCDRASHGDELLYLFFEETGGLMTFNRGSEDYRPQDSDRDVAKNMMTMWSNFAKTG